MTVWLRLACGALLGLVGLGLVQAAEPTVDAVRFRNVGIAQGLSQSTVRAIAEDEQGFLWFGTQDGLNRYDAYEFRAWFRDRRDPAGLRDSHITALHTSGSWLWIGTMAGGLHRMDLSKGSIQRIWPDADAKYGATITAIEPDREGAHYVASSDALLRVNAEGEVSKVPGPPRPWVSLRALKRLQDGRLWAGAANGLWIHEPATQAWQEWRTRRGAAYDVQALAQAADGSLWVGSSRDGLIRVDLEGRELARHRADPARDGSLPDDQVRALLLTRAGQLWVGTANGLALWQAGRDRFLVWRYDAADGGSTAANRIASLYEDRQGLIWVGTWTGGLSMHNPATQNVRLIRHSSRDRLSLPASPVRALFLDGDGSLWMGVQEGGGLVQYDLNRGVRQRWVHDPADPRSLGSSQVQAVRRGPDGRLWVGTQGAGLSRLRSDRGFDHFRHAAEDPRSLPHDVVQALHFDDQGQLWVGTEAGGLARYIDDASGFERYAARPGEDGALQSGNVQAIHQTRDGRLWVGTFGAGLAELDRASGRFRHWQEVPGQLDSLSHNSVTTILETRQGELWLGTQGGGLNRVDRSRGEAELRFGAITKAEGLGADAIGTLVEDQRGVLWMGTTSGVNAYDPLRREVRSFSASEGMDRSGYFIGSAAVGSDGHIYFGGLRGVLMFHPDRLPRPAAPPRVVLSGLSIANQEVEVDPDGQGPLQRMLPYQQRLRLRHDQNLWSVRYSALDFANPEGVRYAWRLEGFSDDWVSGSRSASFTSLPAGTYRLRLKARDGVGGDDGPEQVLVLDILPAPWNSAWAWTLYGAALLAVLGLGLRATARRRRRERATMERVQHSEERLKLALWGSRDELWDLDLRSGEMRRENLLPILAMGADAQLGKLDQFIQMVHDEDRAGLVQAFNDHLEGRTPFFECTLRMPHTEGHWMALLARGIAVERAPDGRALRMVGTTRDVTATVAAADELRRLNDELEQRVEDRTRALKLSNRELKFALGQLQQTQRQLVDSEKMAALGSLVAGIAHEINTPLGIGVTAASHLEDETRRLQRLGAEGALRKSDLESYQKDALDSTHLILSNLKRASQLVRGFKQVAVDQTSEEPREIHLKSYLEEILLSLHPTLKKTAHQVEIQCPEDLVLYTYPGAISQIVVNLVMNSLIHAFDGIANGHITLHCEGYDDEWLLLYRDDGVGMSDDIRQRIFDPFFTTKRGQGGSGLGLHIVYNLITQLLKGSLDCISTPGQGVEFQIQLPKRLAPRGT